MGAFYLTVFSLWVVLSAAAAGALNRWGDLLAAVLQNYPNGGIGAACLAIAAMTFPIRSSLIGKVQAGLETRRYEMVFRAWRDDHPTATILAPVKNLEAAYTTSLLMSFFAAVLNFSVWFLRTALSAGVCIGATLISFGLFCFLALKLHSAIQAGHRRIEEEKHRKFEMAERASLEASICAVRGEGEKRGLS